jgi:DNA topoisomerase-1
LVNKLLVKSFPDIFNVGFTAGLEEELDRVEAGQVKWIQVLKDFYKPFTDRLDQVSVNWKEIKGELEEQTDIACEKCGLPMVVKWGRNGRFLGCSGFPECRTTRPLPGSEADAQAQESDEPCPECGRKLVLRQSKFGRFYACSGYPECKYKKPFTLNIDCPESDCDGRLVEKRSRKGKLFYGCSNYPKCKFATWDKPLAESCPSCDYGILVEKTGRSEAGKKVCPSCRTEVA